MTTRGALEAFRRATAARQGPAGDRPGPATLSDDERAVLRQYLGLLAERGCSAEDRAEYIAAVGETIADRAAHAALVTGWCEALAGLASGVNERIRAALAVRKGLAA